MEIDERFEFDAPRWYDFDSMTSDRSPADAWFDTAPEGPGKRPAAATNENREPFKALQTGGMELPAGPPGSQLHKVGFGAWPVAVRLHARG
jgi:hypothetical protein